MQKLFYSRVNRDSVPYWSSPPVQFVYESTASLSLGKYTWSDTPSALSPDRPIQDNDLYVLNTMTLSADLAVTDFTSAISSTPLFNFHLVGDSKAPFFREPVQMVTFIENFPFRLVWGPSRGSDKLLASFRGVLLQTPALIGKTSITLKAIMSAQEIQDDTIVEDIKTNIGTNRGVDNG